MIIQINNASTFIGKNQSSVGARNRRAGHPAIDEETDFVSPDYRGRADAAIQRYKKYAAGGFVSNDGSAIDLRRIASRTTAKVTDSGAKVFYHSSFAGNIDISL